MSTRKKRFLNNLSPVNHHVVCLIWFYSLLSLKQLDTCSLKLVYLCPTLEIYSPLMLSVAPLCPFKIHSGPYNSHVCEHSPRLSFLLFTRQWYGSREGVTLLFLYFYLFGSKPLTEKTYVGFHLFVRFVTSFSSGYVFCNYIFIIFCWLYYWESFLQWQFLLDVNFTMDLMVKFWGQVVKIWRRVLFFSWHTIFL